MKTLLAALLLFSAQSVFAHCEDPTREQVIELIKVLNVKRNYDFVFAELEFQTRQEMRDLLAKHNISENGVAFSRDVFANLRQRLPWDKLQEYYIAMFTRHFTKQEVEDITVFFSTPSGLSFSDRLYMIGADTKTVNMKMATYVRPQINETAKLVVQQRIAQLNASN